MFGRHILSGFLLLALGAVPASANPFVISPNNNAAQLVNNLVAGAAGITIVGGSEIYTGAASASGTFTGGTGILPFDTGILLTSGAASNAAGPNNNGNKFQINNTPGDAALNTLIPGLVTADAAVLQFDFIPTGNTISFQYVFGSEEYNNSVGTDFVDVAGFFLNGQNIALIPVTLSNITTNSVNCGSNANFYTGNNSEPGGGPTCGNAGLNTQYDGLVGANAGFALFATGTVNVGVLNHIKLAIADGAINAGADTILDSGVFLKAGSFQNTSSPAADPVPEPATLMLFGSGLACIVAFSGRRRRS